MKNGKAILRKKSPKQNPPINENIPSGNTLSLGELDLIFEINFTDQDLLNPNAKSEDPEKYYKLENLNTIKDLSFISSLSIDFINRIKLKPNNHLIRQILLGNKISKKKNSVEFISFNLPLFENEEEKFFQKIFDKVCMNYKLNINKKPLYKEGRYSLIIQLKHKNEYKEIILGQTPKMFREEKYQEEKEKRELDEEKENDKKEKDKKEREEKKKEKIEEYKEERENIKNGIISEKQVKSLYKNKSYFVDIGDKLHKTLFFLLNLGIFFSFIASFSSYSSSSWISSSSSENSFFSLFFLFFIFLLGLPLGLPLGLLLLGDGL